MNASVWHETFITTHSPYVLERMPVEAVGRIERGEDGAVSWRPISATNIKQINLFSKRLRHSFCEGITGTWSGSRRRRF